MTDEPRAPDAPEEPHDQSDHAVPPARFLPHDPVHPRARAARAVWRRRSDPMDLRARFVPGERDVPFNPHELALETQLHRTFASLNVRPEDKAVVDALQGLLSFHHGRRLAHWDVFTILLADALGNREGVIAQTGFGG